MDTDHSGERKLSSVMISFSAMTNSLPCYEITYASER